ncbi:MAG TPA: hypothetical protein VK361_11010 [Rubrobacteraceae bacterium]|nr:hypothetical protein [Rubrobacteraceae bacterium]
MVVPASARLVFNALFVALATVVLALIGGWLGGASPGLRLTETPFLETFQG